MNGVIVYFPWGAGGNLVKNIIAIDPRFEFIDEVLFKQSDQYKLIYEAVQSSLSDTLLLPANKGVLAEYIVALAFFNYCKRVA